MTPKIVGVVGLGAMGRPIAARLAGAGFDVLGHDVGPVEAPAGVRMVDTLAGLATADVVFVLVPEDRDVEAVVDGLIAGGRAGLVIAVSSSVRPDTCRHLEAEAHRAGMRLLDVALTGGIRGAEAGRLNLLVGGDAAVLDEIRDVLLAMATGYHLLGDVGAGQVGKAASNLIHWAEIVAITEALRLARRWGVSPIALRRALTEGGTDSRSLRELELMHFTWYAKDLAVAAHMADDVGMHLPVASLARRLMDDVTVTSVDRLLRS